MGLPGLGKEQESTLREYCSCQLPPTSLCGGHIPVKSITIQ